MNATALFAQAREHRDASVARVEPALASLPDPLPKNVMSIAKDVLTPEEIKITSFDVPELLAAIRNKTFSCETVTRAFLRRAALAQKLVISLTVSHLHERVSADHFTRRIAAQSSSQNGLSSVQNI